MHRLEQFESDFMEPGYRAVCSCGWQSEPYPNMDVATEAFHEHVALADEVSK